MAILKDDQVLCLSSRWQDCTKFTIKDESVYTDVGDNGRDDAARVLLAAKMDENQVLAFITDVDNTDPLNTLEWELTSSGDGAYRFFYFNILFYNVLTTYQWEVKDSDGVITQYGDIIYKNGTYYTPKVATVIAVEPEVTLNWEDSWSIYTGNFESLIASDRLDIHIHDDIITCELEDCIKDEVIDKNDTVLCGVCVTPDALEKVLTMELLLWGANALNWQEKATRAEVVIKETLKKYCGC